MIKIALLFAAALLASTTPALADSDPSFDCVQASTPEEKLICSDDTLADLDRQLAASYAKLLEEHEDLRSFIENSQKKWLKHRNGGHCTASNDPKYQEQQRGCMAYEYSLRLKNLTDKTFLVCERQTTSHLDFSLLCHAPNDPLRLSFLVSGTYPTSGYSQYASGDTVALTRLDISANGQKAQELSLGSIITPNAAEHALELMDINFDGYSDIKLLVDQTLSTNATYDYWLYEPQTGQFTGSDLGFLLSGTQIKTDPQTQTISVVGASGGSWETTSYRWAGKALVVHKRVQDGSVSGVNIPPLKKSHDDLRICAKQTDYYDDKQQLTRIEIEPGSLCESDKLSPESPGFRELLDALREHPNGYSLTTSDASHITLTFEPPLPSSPQLP